jgi:hypothetical protein
MSSAKGINDSLSPDRDKVMPEEGFVIEKGNLVSGSGGELWVSS